MSIAFTDWVIDYQYERTDRMKKHTKVLCDYWGYAIPEDIACIVCGNYAVDTHHIKNRKSGSSKNLDYPENLAPLCREHHTQAEHNPKFNAYVYKTLLLKIIDKIETDERI
jgi:hypothetical protein